MISVLPMLRLRSHHFRRAMNGAADSLVGAATANVGAHVFHDLLKHNPKPTREQIVVDVTEQLIVELYSKS